MNGFEDEAAASLRLSDDLIDVYGRSLHSALRAIDQQGNA